MNIRDREHHMTVALLKYVDNDHVFFLTIGRHLPSVRHSLQQGTACMPVMQGRILASCCSCYAYLQLVPGH